MMNFINCTVFVFFFLPVGIGLSGVVLNDLAKGKVSEMTQPILPFNISHRLNVTLISYLAIVYKYIFCTHERIIAASVERGGPEKLWVSSRINLLLLLGLKLHGWEFIALTIASYRKQLHPSDRTHLAKPDI